MTLNGKVAIITGASSGIGTAVARELRQVGMRLVLTSRREDRLTGLAEELGEAVPVPGDLCDPRLPQRLVDEACQRFGRVDVVFNNAGVMPPAATVAETDIEQVCQMARINVEAAYRLAYTVLKYFQSIGSGDLINTSSILGTKVRPTVGAYAGTKHALEALTEALRMELAGTDIRVMSLEPGLVLTELHQDWPVHPADSFGISRPLDPEDIARCVLFMLEQPRHVLIPCLMATPAQQSL